MYYLCSTVNYLLFNCFLYKVLEVIFYIKGTSVNKSSFMFLLLLTISFFFIQPCMADSLMIAAGATSDYRPLLSVSNDYGTTWVNSLPINEKSFFQAVNCDVSGNICIAGGQPVNTRTTNIMPLLYLSHDRGNHWSHVDIPNLPAAMISFNGVGCIGEGDTATCFASGGAYFNDNLDTFQSLFLVTTDGGKNWSQPLIGQLPSQSYLGSATCSSNAANAVCVVVGSGFMVVSNDGGKNWSVKNAPFLPQSSHVSCTGDGANAVCVVVSDSSSSILVSKDSGNTWALKAIQNEPSAVATGVSCTGAAPTALCVISGNRYDTPEHTNTEISAMLAVSNDNGDTWVSHSSTELTFKGYFDGVSCAGSDNKVCVATANKVNDSVTAAVAISKDGAKTWSFQDLPNERWWGLSYPVHSIHQVNCEAMSPTKVACVVVGYMAKLQPVILTTKDVGSPWELHHIDDKTSGWFEDLTIAA
jgi:photosystem II stability/assembly factor-like uncharacterized protein